MSTVPPSPPCASTRMSSRPVARNAAATPAAATDAAFANSECSHGTCHELSGYGVENTSRQPVAFTATRRPFGGADRGVDDVARRERLAAPLAGTVSGVQRVGALGVGLLGAVASAAAAGCRRHGCRPGRTSRSTSWCLPSSTGRDDLAKDARGGRARTCDAALAAQLALDDVGVEVEEAENSASSSAVSRREHRAHGSAS